MKESRYKGPKILVRYLEKTVKITKNSRVLDVGCGTDLLGVQLKQHDYMDYCGDGLDLSEEMLVLAVAKNCYKLTALAKITSGHQEKFMPVDYLYDAILFCSSFERGHIAPEHLEKLASQFAVEGQIIWCCRSLSTEKRAKTPFSDQMFEERVEYLGRRCGLVLTRTRPEENFQKGVLEVLGPI